MGIPLHAGTAGCKTPREEDNKSQPPLSGDLGMLYSEDPLRASAEVAVKGLSALTNTAAKASHRSELRT